MRSIILMSELIFAAICLCVLFDQFAFVVFDRELRQVMSARIAVAFRDEKGDSRIEYVHRHIRELIEGTAKSPLHSTFIKRIDLWEERRREKRRCGACMDELPELIDVIVLGLSAGISFDASLEIYCERYKTMLSSYLQEAMRSWQLGFKSRRKALEDLAQELNSDAFSTFVTTINESLTFGAPLAKTLTEQSDAVRMRRRSDLEEQVEKAPVKMLIPIGTMVLPAMILAIIGPLFSSYLLGS